MRKIFFGTLLALLVSETALADIQYALPKTSGGAPTSGAVPVVAGGTGQITATAAFDALSPNTTAGDITYFDGTHNVRLPKGSDGNVLKLVNGLPAWGSSATATYYQTVLSNLVAQTQRSKLNFASTMTLSDSSGGDYTSIDIAAGGITSSMLATSAVDLSGTKVMGTLAAASFPATSGDVSNIAGSLSLTVAKLQGRTVSTTAPTDGYALTWVAADSSWEPVAIPTFSVGSTLTYVKEVAATLTVADSTSSSTPGASLTIQAGKGATGAVGGTTIVKGGAGGTGAAAGGVSIQGGGNTANITIGASLTGAVTIGSAGSTINLSGTISAPIPELMGSNIASASTIAPTKPIHHVTGTTTINTITAPGSPGDSLTLTIIPDGAFSFGTSGNINNAMTAVVGVPIYLVYDLGLTKWFATSPAIDLGTAAATGTLATARLPAFSGGDVTSSAGSVNLAIGAGKVLTTMLGQGAGQIVLLSYGGSIASTTGDTSIQQNSNLPINKTFAPVTNDIYHVHATWQQTTAVSSAGTLTVRLKWGNTTICSTSALALGVSENKDPWVFDGYIIWESTSVVACGGALISASSATSPANMFAVGDGAGAILSSASAAGTSQPDVTLQFSAATAGMTNAILFAAKD